MKAMREEAAFIEASLSAAVQAEAAALAIEATRAQTGADGPPPVSAGAAGPPPVSAVASGPPPVLAAAGGRAVTEPPVPPVAGAVPAGRNATRIDDPAPAAEGEPGAGGDGAEAEEEELREEEYARTQMGD